MAKIGVSLDDDLLARVDKYADENYMSRSGLITFACSQFLNQVEVMGLIKDMSLAMRKIADSGQVDDEVMEQLEDFQRFASILSK